MLKLKHLITLIQKKTALVDKQFEEFLISINIDTSAVATIKLKEYKPNYLKYTSNTTLDQLAVFSEIYYDKGWNAYVDGELKPHFRANYVLRAMQIPKGDHTIEFKFEPIVYSTGESISFISSILLLLLLGFVSFKELKS